MKPTIGRIVHFVTEREYSADPKHELRHLAAMVVRETPLMLQAFGSGSASPRAPMSFFVEEPFENQNGDSHYSWHWPEKVNVPNT